MEEIKEDVGALRELLDEEKRLEERLASTRSNIVHKKETIVEEIEFIFINDISDQELEVFEDLLDREDFEGFKRFLREISSKYGR